MRRTALILPLAVLLSAISGAQVNRDPLHFKSTLGSLKMLNCVGTTTVSFNGTLLLVGVDGSVTTAGSLKKEFDSPKMRRTSYFGKGTVTVTGKWRSILIFGSHISGSLKITEGRSKVRFYGEFDQNLDTGFYWYGDRVKDKLPWYATGIEVDAPENPRSNPRPQRRGGYGG